MQLLFCWSLVTICQGSPALGETTIRSAWENSVPASAAFSLPDGRESPTLHLTRRIEDLPAPTDAIVLPSPAATIRTPVRDDKPFTLDYVFMGRAGMTDPATNIKFNQIGLDYRLTRPFFKTPAVFTFRPGAEIIFLSGPGGASPEIAEQLYKVAFDFQVDVPINEIVGVSLGITPGLWSDFIVIDGDDFRLPARVLATFRVSETLFAAAGVIYTDNIRRNILPGIGVIWDPNDRWHLEALYPRSRLVYRFNEDYSAYLVFERGGTTYNIRALAEDEDVEYRDLRLMLGAEIHRWTQADVFVEAGVTFDRKFRFDNQGAFNVGEAFILRVGTRF
jgi:hypothetical protein